MLVPLSQLPLSFFMSLPGALLLDFLRLSLTFMPLSYCVSLRKLHGAGPDDSALRVDATNTNVQWKGKLL